MPRVQIERAALCALCAVCAAFAACAEDSAPALSSAQDPSVLPDEPDGVPAVAPRSLGAPIDGPEEAPPVCQSQFFGADPLADEQSVRSCSYALASAVLNPANVLVKIAGQARAAGDDENGWALLADGTTVLLLGLACDDVLAGADMELSALCE